MTQRWLQWARELQAIAQNGLTYATDPHDRDRYETIRTLAADIAGASSGADPGYVRDLFAQEKGHATPKVDVRGAVFRDEKILLVQERQDGLWTLPGGWADIGESPATAVVREVYEESGYQTQAVRLLALYDRDKHGHTPLPYYVYKIFFLCALEEPAAPLSNSAHNAAFMETTSADFFQLDKLPDLSIARVTAVQIARLFELYRHPDWPPDFD